MQNKTLRWWHWWAVAYVAGAFLVMGCSDATHGTVKDKRISGLNNPELLIENMGAKGNRAEWEAVSQAQYDECQIGEEWTEENGCD